MHRPIEIAVVLNGYIAKVGCQTVVFQSLDELMTAMRRYLLDPAGEEQRFVKEAKNGYDANAPAMAAQPMMSESAYRRQEMARTTADQVNMDRYAR